MIGVANVNGIITDLDKAAIPVLDRGNIVISNKLYIPAFFACSIWKFMQQKAETQKRMQKGRGCMYIYF